MMTASRPPGRSTRWHAANSTPASRPGPAGRAQPAAGQAAMMTSTARPAWRLDASSRTAAPPGTSRASGRAAGSRSALIAAARSRYWRSPAGRPRTRRALAAEAVIRAAVSGSGMTTSSPGRVSAVTTRAPAAAVIRRGHGVRSGPAPQLPGAGNAGPHAGGALSRAGARLAPACSGGAVSGEEGCGMTVGAPAAFR